AEICGAELVGTPGTKISDDSVARTNPDVIVLAWAATGDRARPEKAYCVREWRNIPAVVNRRVFVLRDELLNTPAPVLTRGCRELARILSECRAQMEKRS